jgi:hypothetical protein
MGPPSVRRDILEKHREDKKGCGPSRRARRGARVSKDGKLQDRRHEFDRNVDLKGTTVPTAGLAQLSVNPQTSGRIANATGGKEKETKDHRDIYDDTDADDDEFFDAEEASLGGCTVTDDGDEPDHGAGD